MGEIPQENHVMFLVSSDIEAYVSLSPLSPECEINTLYSVSVHLIINADGNEHIRRTKAGLGCS